MRLLSFSSLLFFTALLVALLSAAKPPVSPEQWPNTLWIYSISLFLAIGGLILWHLHIRQHAKIIHSTDQPLLDLSDCLHQFLSEMQELAQELANLDHIGILARIESLLELHVWPLVNQHPALLNTLGITQSMQFFLKLAQCERLLNRVTSAASDGYLEEAHHTYSQALLIVEDMYYDFSKKPLLEKRKDQSDFTT